MLVVKNAVKLCCSCTVIIIDIIILLMSTTYVIRSDALATFLLEVKTISTRHPGTGETVQIDRFKVKIVHNFLCF